MEANPHTEKIIKGGICQKIQLSSTLKVDCFFHLHEQLVEHYVVCGRLIHQNFIEATQLAQVLSEKTDASAFDSACVAIVALHSGELSKAREYAQLVGDTDRPRNAAHFVAKLVLWSVEYRETGQCEDDSTFLEELKNAQGDGSEVELLAHALRLYFRSMPILAIALDVKHLLNRRIHTFPPVVASELALGCSHVLLGYGFEILALEVLRHITIETDPHELPVYYTMCIARLAQILISVDQHSQAIDLVSSHVGLVADERDNGDAVLVCALVADIFAACGDTKKAQETLNSFGASQPNLFAPIIALEIELSLIRVGIKTNTSSTSQNVVQQCVQRAAELFDPYVTMQSIGTLHRIAVDIGNTHPLQQSLELVSTFLKRCCAYQVKRETLRLLAFVAAQQSDFRSSLLYEREVQELDEQHIDLWHSMQVEAFNQMSVDNVLTEEKPTVEIDKKGVFTRMEAVETVAENMPLPIAQVTIEGNYEAISLLWCNKEFSALAQGKPEEFLADLIAHSRLKHVLEDHKDAKTLVRDQLHPTGERACFDILLSGQITLKEAQVQTVFLRDVTEEMLADFRQHTVALSTREHLQLATAVFDIVKERSLHPTAVLLDDMKKLQKSEELNSIGVEIATGCARSVLQINKLLTSIRRLVAHEKAAHKQQTIVDVIALTRQCINEKQTLASEFDCTLEYNSTLDRIEVAVDIEAYDLAMDFVLQSAIKNSRGGDVTVSVQRSINEAGASFCEISVHDCGDVVPNSESFSGAYDAVGFGRRIGLDLELSGVGLSISSRLIDSQSGTLSVSAAKNGGIIVAIRLPVA